MSRLLRRFSTLRWRLTLSCFVAAFTAMMSLMGMFVLVPGIIAMNTPQRPIALAQSLQKLAPRIAPDLRQTPPDRSRIAATLAMYNEPILIPEGLTDNLHSSASVMAGKNAALLVMGRDGQMLAALTPASKSESDLAHVQELSEAKAVVAAALHNDPRTMDLVQATQDGQTVAAAPIIDTGGTVRGALLIGVDLTALLRPIYLRNLLALLSSAILFGIVASVFGVIFGLLTAHGLTRRLRRLTTVADAWSQGDFTASARDPSSDELGQLARDLNRMAEQLQNLLQDRQQLAAVEERNRLARDLHDSVKQQMFALTMLVGSAQMEVEEHSEAQRILSEAGRIASNAQQELTSLIQALRPVALANKGLSAALRELCDDWSKRTGIAYDAHIPDALTLTPTAEQDVFRTVQEALANIARHSGATRVGVHAECEQNVLALRIRDNGRGFDVTKVDGQGVGLRSMRERVEGLGGTLHISSSVGGTRLEMRIPLPPLSPQAPSQAQVSVSAASMATTPHTSRREA